MCNETRGFVRANASTETYTHNEKPPKMKVTNPSPDPTSLQPSPMAAETRPHTPMSSSSSISSASTKTSRRPSISSIPTIRDNNTTDETCDATLSHTVSHSHDIPLAPFNSHISIDPAIYDRHSDKTKHIIVAVISFCSFLAPLASTAVLSAVPEVAEEYNTTGSIVNISNALYMLFMGISPTFWGPMSQIYGRRWVSDIFVVLRNPLLLCYLGGYVDLQLDSLHQSSNLSLSVSKFSISDANQSSLLTVLPLTHRLPMTLVE